jgi:hypothetical protein
MPWEFRSDRSSLIRDCKSQIYELLRAEFASPEAAEGQARKKGRVRSSSEGGDERESFCSSVGTEVAVDNV